MNYHFSFSFVHVVKAYLSRFRLAGTPAIGSFFTKQGDEELRIQNEREKLLPIRSSLS